MNANETTTKTVTVSSTSQQELVHALNQAVERNRTQRAAEFETDDIVVTWTLKVGDQHPTIKTRYTAKLYRATSFAPINPSSTNKGHSMRGAFKPVMFQFDVKTGDIFFLNWETSDRKNAVHAVSWLIEEFGKGKHNIANGNYKVSGYDQTKKPRFASWLARYNGKIESDSAFTVSKLDSDLKKVQKD